MSKVEPARVTDRGEKKQQKKVGKDTRRTRETEKRMNQSAGTVI